MLVSVEATDCRNTAAQAEPVPDLEMACRRTAEEAHGIAQKGAASQGVRQASAESLVRLHSSMPPHTVVVEQVPACGGAISVDMREPSEKGCAAKATPPASSTAVQISRSVRPAWGISSSRPNTSRCPAFGDTSCPTSTSTLPRQPSSPRRRASSVS